MKSLSYYLFAGIIFLSLGTLKAQNIITVLVGMRIFKNFGRDYAERFEKIYPDLAKTYDLILMPFFLEGVAANPGLNLDDGIHFGRG